MLKKSKSNEKVKGCRHLFNKKVKMKLYKTKFKNNSTGRSLLFMLGFIR